MIRKGASHERWRNCSYVESNRSGEEYHDNDGNPLSTSPQEANREACTKSCNRRVSGSIARLRQNHQLIWSFQASMLLLCLHSVASRFDSISALPTVEGMQRRLSVRGKQTSDTSFRQPRVLQVDDSSFQAVQNLVHHSVHKESEHEIQITKSERRAKKNLRNSYQYKKWQRDPLREGDCEPMDPWQETSFPSCNLMHEVDVAQQMEVLTEGGYNTIYKMKDIDGATHIVKILKYERDYSDRNFDRVRRDSLLMERASGSDYVVDTYSFCGFAQVIEYGKGGNLGDFLHGDHYRRITQNQKLQIATQVTQALADLHNLEGTGISSTTHGDFATKQYIFVNGRFKLSDFNRGRFIRWNKKTQEACPYTIGHNGDKFRAPEEYIKGAPQTAAIDVWALGSLLVEVVSGLPVWYGYDNEVAQKAILEGIKPPFLREQISNPSGPINEVLLEAIDMCWVYEAKDRPKAGFILGYLKKEAMRLGIKWNEPFKLNGH
ncbi:unnamed protein product [Cylindrotheca closterium]|uniref:non-specific serine/threonine protein kinase n=1 Tax=Cylindrotheca closterium TaxID=2856 RepID=A0AAD2CGH9_9STRA|nr:unnamed protein product [Cylindrotheca closterium]